MDLKPSLARIDEIHTLVGAGAVGKGGGGGGGGLDVSNLLKPPLSRGMLQVCSGRAPGGRGGARVGLGCRVWGF